MTVLPMFPLGSVLLPGGILTLHVFEPRYRALVQQCIETEQHEFGVVLIERGSEVGGGDVRRSVGTVAQMVQVAQTPDGRYAVVAVGTRRVVVQEWLADAPYPRADVEEWVDDDHDADDLDELVAALTPRVRRATALALELGDEVGDPNDEISTDPLVASYQLVGLAPLETADRYDLLTADGPRLRLEALADHLDEIEPVLRFRLDAPNFGGEVGQEPA